jgi:signal transduction histidine kinase/CheY-like chemotaxis protein
MENTETIADHLAKVHYMYSVGESREKVFDYFLQYVIEISECQVGFIGEIVEESNLKFIKSIASYGTKKESFNYAILDQQDIFHPIFEEKAAITCDKKTLKKHMSSSYNQEMWESPHIHSMVIVPIMENDAVAGVIVLCHKSSTMKTKNTLAQIHPLSYICASLLKGFKTQSLKDIYENIVNHVSVPILVFTKGSIHSWILPHKVPKKVQSEPAINQMCNLSDFHCIVQNKAFSKLCRQFDARHPLYSVSESHISNTLSGKGFYDCFPNMIDNQLIHGRWNLMWENEEKTIIDTIKYYDKCVPEDIYSIEFNKLDSISFMMIIQPISEQLQAKKMLQDLAKTQEEFIAKISHELRTPVNAILSLITLLFDSPFAKQSSDASKDLRQKLQMMSESSVTLCSLIQDVLDYTQLKTKKLKVSYQTFDLLECVESSLSLIDIEANRKGLSLKKTVDPNVPLCIVSDPKRLKQILVNLLTNAVKFTKTGEVSLHISLNKPTATNNIFQIKFSIKDTGIGIKESDKHRLFHPFTQIDNDENQGTSNGTGLGLVIARHLANLLGGDINFESQINVGSTFYFTIRARACGIDSMKEYYGPILKNKSVLLIEPQMESKNRVVRYLIEEGVETVSCDNLEIGLTYLKSNIYRFDIVIVDEQFAQQVSEYHPNLILISQNPNKRNSFSNMSTGSNKLYRDIERTHLLQACYSCIMRSPSRSHNMNMGQALPLPFDGTTKKELSILVAEDDFINRQVIVEILQKLGYSKVQAVENGLEAYKLLQETKFDVLLLDLKMPVMNGYQLFSKLKTSFSKNDIPTVIALTASAMASDQEHCIKMGMNYYLPKPVQIEILREILNTI